MGRPSKFTAQKRRECLEAASVGASRNQVAAVARIDPATLKRWLDKGKESSAGSPFAKFREDFLAAEAHPKMRALGVVYGAMEDRPDLAWKFIERRVEGYAPPMPSATPVAQPVLIQLSLADGSMPAFGDVVEGEVVDEQDDISGPAALPSA